MTRALLQQASDELRRASELAPEDATDRVYEQSTQLARLATGDRDPDHGRLARHTNALAEIAADLDEAGASEAADHVREARSLINEYRKDLPGV
jgi:predicted transcriptional regulator